jgi:hypothetical protein
MFHRRYRHAFAHVVDGRELRRHHLRSHLVLGGALVAIGLAWLLHGWGMIGDSEAWLAAPAVLAWSGLVRLAFDRDVASIVRATISFALAAYLVVVIEQVGGLTWGAAWPVLMIAAGVGTLIDALIVRSRARDGAREEATW